jgi:NAD(P)-dependent dehydrogenase (short-subunit alcohol dehydrogenase family)
VEVEEVAGNMADEADIQRVVTAHRERFGRLDVLVNNAGVGIGAAWDEHATKRVDLQLAVNLRAIVLFYRECADMLKAAGAEHRNALVVNLSSISGKAGQAWLSVYSATKAGVIGYTQAMNKELNAAGIKSVALCPGFVDTPMTEFVREHVPAEEMIRVEDIAGAGPLRARDVSQLRHPGDRVPAPRGGVVSIATNRRKVPPAAPFYGAVRLHIVGRRPHRGPHHRRGHRRQPPSAPAGD